MGIEYLRRTPAPISDLAEETMVRMRDGIRLATDVYLPDGNREPGPTILVRLPYDKNGAYSFMPEIAEHMTRRGYRVVAQDVRGKFRSEGETLMAVNEAYDGYDTIDWITKQPWSDGIVGMWGESYYGLTQWAAASTAHPALRAIVPRHTGTRLAEIPPTEPEWAFGRQYLLTHFHGNDDIEWEFDWTRRPYADTVEEFFATVGSRSASYDLTFPHQVALRRFPAGHPFDAPAVPTLMLMGWWDNCAHWQWQDYAELLRRPAWSRLLYLQIEATDHENYSHFDLPITPENDPAVNQRARQRMFGRYIDPSLDFFDVFLRGHAGTIPRIRWQLANSGDRAFHESPSWPPPGTRTLVLHASGSSLIHEPGPSEVVTWVHDPEDPVPSPMPDSFAFLRYHPDEQDTMNRKDVLAFTTDPVTTDLDLTGPVTVQARVSSDGPELDLFARLLDVSPDGAAHLITRGRTTAIGLQDITVSLGHIGYRLRSGHSLRLMIASTDAPEFIPAPGNGEHRWLAQSTKPNTQQVHLGPDGGLTVRLTVAG